MNVTTPNSFRTGPDENGLFGIYGGRFVAETLMPLVLDLEREYRKAQADPAFQAEFEDLEQATGSGTDDHDLGFTRQIDRRQGLRLIGLPPKGRALKSEAKIDVIMT